MATLEEIEKRRSDRKAALRVAEKEQLAIDLDAIDALECEHGDSNVCRLEVPFLPGLPVRVAARCPTEPEVKRYRDRVKPDKKGRPGDPVGAHEELAECCRIYPDADTYAKLRAARPALHGHLGAKAIELAGGREEEAGKD